MVDDKLPSETRILIAGGIKQLEKEGVFNLHPKQRLEIIRSIGAMFANDVVSRQSYTLSYTLPELTFADRVRVRIAKYSAEKVIPLWKTACQETDARCDDDEEYILEELQRETIYQEQIQYKKIEDISVYDVPRAHIPSHISKMAIAAWNKDVSNIKQFRHQTNEWWQLYGGGGGVPREIAIKWAAQEYLYEVVGMSQYHNNIRKDGKYAEEDIFNEISHGPGGYAALAFSDPSIDEEFHVNREKVREFWLWWLKWNIPTSWTDELLKKDLQ